MSLGFLLRFTLGALPRFHLALLLEEADHQTVGFERRNLGVTSEAIPEIEQVPGALAEAPLGLGRFDIGEVLA